MRDQHISFVARSKPYREASGKTVCDRCGIDYARTKIQCQECFDNKHCADCRSITHHEHSELGTSLNECKNGHPYNEENTATRKNGQRRCRACNREHVAAYERRRNERKNAA